MTQGALLDRLRQMCGADAVITDTVRLDEARHDVHHSGCAPLAILAPDDADSLPPAIAAITEAGLSVAPRGGGLSYTAGYLPQTGRTILVDMGRLSRILEIRPDDMTVTVEAGVTWKQLYEALAPHRLRLPFFGTFSGKGATVGGGLSHGALFFGSARYGSAADMVLGLDVALADGRLMRTGQGMLKAAPASFLRNHGPELTGLFLHDGGALGVKLRATLRLIRMPAAFDHASFAFPGIEHASDALCALAREGLAEDIYIMDPAATDHLDLDSADMMRSAMAVARASGGAMGAMKSLVAMGRAGKSVIPRGHYSLHVTAAARSKEAAAADISDAVRIARAHGGEQVTATIPMVARADLFANLNGVLGPEGGRWAALNAKVAHSDARRLIAAFDAMIEPHAAEMAEKGVRYTRLASALWNHCYSFEPVFHWHDAWLPLHRQAPDPSHLARQAEPKANPEARALVDRLRLATVELFRDIGAVSNQIGRVYPYLSALEDGPRDLLLTLKHTLDPDKRMNPGVLEFP
ncbi:FAD-binding oxidoreductase [Sandaracinobacteroides sp. A072]|uniref:FAD-binding oxidoreductase n=1 Tax=Sandaracinobacteroides sp. A072 TaxID=3461146 RepID=UPI004042BC40